MRLCPSNLSAEADGQRITLAFHVPAKVFQGVSRAFDLPISERSLRLGLELNVTRLFTWSAYGALLAMLELVARDEGLIRTDIVDPVADLAPT